MKAPGKPQENPTCNHLNFLWLLLLFVFAMPFVGGIFLDCLALSILLVFRLCVVIFLSQFPLAFPIFHFSTAWQTVILTFHAHLFVMLFFAFLASSIDSAGKVNISLFFVLFLHI